MEENIHFAFIKTTEGENYKDPEFIRNRNEASNVVVGIPEDNREELANCQLFILKADESFKRKEIKPRIPHDIDILSSYFIDAGDYDADGQSEIIFFVSGYNEDGYALFYDSFQKNIVYTWSYH